MVRDIKLIGSVVKVLGNNNYEVEVEIEGYKRIALCYLSGKMCLNKINVIVGDRVQVVLSPPYERGRITFRAKE